MDGKDKQVLITATVVLVKDVGCHLRGSLSVLRIVAVQPECSSNAGRHISKELLRITASIIACEHTISWSCKAPSGLTRSRTDQGAAVEPQRQKGRHCWCVCKECGCCCGSWLSLSLSLFSVYRWDAAVVVWLQPRCLSPPFLGFRSEFSFSVEVGCCSRWSRLRKVRPQQIRVLSMAHRVGPQVSSSRGLLQPFT